MKLRLGGLLFAALLMGIGIGARQAKAEDFQLKNDRVRFQVSEATGALAGGWCQTSGVKCLSAAKDHYILDTEKDTKESDETKDALTAASDGVKTVNGAQELTLTCRNAEMGLAIVKKYRLEANADRIYKDVTFDGPAGQLLTYRCEAVLEPAFREGGYYHRLCHSWRSPKPFYEAKYVSQDTMVDVANVLQVSFLNPKTGGGIGFYRNAVNGRYLFFSSAMVVFALAEDEKVYYTATGWRMPVFKDFLKEGYRPVVQTAYTIFTGEPATFHREYQELMEAQLDEIDSSISAPDWAKHIKFDAGTGTGTWEKALDVMPKMAAKLARGYPGYLTVINWGFRYMGDWYARDEDVKGMPDDKFLKPSHIAEMLKKFHAQSPWIKGTIYTFPAYIEKDSLLYKAHPDWVIFAKDGKPRITWPRGFVDKLTGRAYLREFKGPAGPAYVQQLSDVMTGLDLDYFYMDGPVNMEAVADWGPKVCNQDYDGYDYSKKIVEIARRRNGAVDRNFSLPGFSDFGYWEAPMQSLYEEDWRLVADRLFLVKLYQRHHRALLPAVLPSNRDGQRLLINYWIGLGFTPQGAGALFTQPCWVLEAMPYVNAAFELKNTELVDADVRPYFVTDRKTDIEAYTLQQGAARLIAVINHGPKKASVTVSADREKLGLKANRRTMSWLIAPKDLTQQDFSKVTWESPIDHLVDNTLLRVEEKLGERVEYTLDLEPEIVRIVLVTQSPALVYSINGERTQCLLPDAGGADVSLNGSYDEEQKGCRVNVATAQKEVEILIHYPKRWEMPTRGLNLEASDGSNVMEAHIPYEVVTLDGERFLKMKAKGYRMPYDIYVR